MAERKLFAGHAVRRLRRSAGLTQAAMAETLGISPSYLNLIERNQRPLTAALLLRLAEPFDFDPRALAASEPGGGAEAMRRRLADPMFADLEIDRARAGGMAGGARRAGRRRSRAPMTGWAAAARRRADDATDPRRRGAPRDRALAQPFRRSRRGGRGAGRRTAAAARATCTARWPSGCASSTSCRSASCRST